MAKTKQMQKDKSSSSEIEIKKESFKGKKLNKVKVPDTHQLNKDLEPNKKSVVSESQLSEVRVGLTKVGKKKVRAIVDKILPHLEDSGYVSGLLLTFCSAKKQTEVVNKLKNLIIEGVPISVTTVNKSDKCSKEERTSENEHLASPTVSSEQTTTKTGKRKKKNRSRKNRKAKMMKMNDGSTSVSVTKKENEEDHEKEHDDKRESNEE